MSLGYMVNATEIEHRKEVALTVKKGYGYEDLVVDSGDYDGASDELKDHMGDLFDECQNLGMIAFEQTTSQLERVR